ncbi:MAG: anthranilate phosphoribosyltransferase, partial [Actinomycetes bacterium]
GFCFAPHFHPGFRHAAGPRRELGVATVFNFLGPLTNPAQPGAQAVGVSDARMAAVMADVLAARGTSALVFRGDDGLDELTTSTTSRVWVVGDGAVSETSLDPRALGLSLAPVEALRGGTADKNAKVARGFLAGERGAVRDAVLLNAAGALAAAEPSAATLTDRLAVGLQRAGEAVDSGAAEATLARWTETSQALKRA